SLRITSSHVPLPQGQGCLKRLDSSQDIRIEGMQRVPGYAGRSDRLAFHQNAEAAMEIFKEFRFEAAHRLSNLPPSHKCHRLHGHSYTVRVIVRGSVSPDTGWVIDFADIKKAMAPLIEQLDHQFLNEVEGMGHPTTENLARWIWHRLWPALPGLARLEIWETESSGCIYTGENG